jgi:hypothetical protein
MKDMGHAQVATCHYNIKEDETLNSVLGTVPAFADVAGFNSHARDRARRGVRSSGVATVGLGG